MPTNIKIERQRVAKDAAKKLTKITGHRTLG